jgi:hypothetical protein
MTAPMTPADKYRAKAAEMLANSQTETSPIARGELMKLAEAYIRLARLADQNARSDLVYETPVRETPDAHDLN